MLKKEKKNQEERDGANTEANAREDVLDSLDPLDRGETTACPTCRASVLLGGRGRKGRGDEREPKKKAKLKKNNNAMGGIASTLAMLMDEEEADGGGSGGGSGGGRGEREVSRDSRVVLGQRRAKQEEQMLILKADDKVPARRPLQTRAFLTRHAFEAESSEYFTRRLGDEQQQQQPTTVDTTTTPSTSRERDKGASDEEQLQRLLHGHATVTG